MRQNGWLYRSVVAIAALWSFSCFAYQFGVVAVDGTDLKEGPGPTYRTIQKLARGTPVTATDQPTNGYYKVRAAKEGVGWIATAAFRPKQVATTPNQSRPVESNSEESTSGQKKFSVKVFGGLGLIAAGALNTQLGGAAFSSGIGYGAELGYAISQRITILARLEFLQSQLTDNDVTTKNTYNLALNAMPISAGLEYRISSESLSIGLAGLVGIASPKLAATATNLAAPNETDISGSAIGFMFRADAALRLSNWLAIYLEGGYRLLNASTTTLTAGAGSALFGTPATPLALDMSGPLFALGLKLSF